MSMISNLLNLWQKNPTQCINTNIYIYKVKYTIYLVKAMAFPVVMYGCENSTIKKAEH